MNNSQYQFILKANLGEHKYVTYVILAIQAWTSFLAYSSTDNFLSPIAVSDCLIFCLGIRYFIKKRNRNDENTLFFFDKKTKQKNVKKVFVSIKQHTLL